MNAKGGRWQQVTWTGHTPHPSPTHAQPSAPRGHPGVAADPWVMAGSTLTKPQLVPKQPGAEAATVPCVKPCLPLPHCRDVPDLERVQDAPTASHFAVPELGRKALGGPHAPSHRTSSPTGSTGTAAGGAQGPGHAGWTRGTGDVQGNCPRSRSKAPLFLPTLEGSPKHQPHGDTGDNCLPQTKRLPAELSASARRVLSSY